jgi:hypothetical protein
MFNKQLKVNIKDLDVQIGKLSKEVEELKKDNKYEATMDKLKSLTELRVNLAKSLKEDETSDAVLEMDKQIEELTKLIQNLGRDEEYSDKLAKLEELTKVRCQLAESKENGSVKPIVVSGLLSVASLVIVLKYEEKDVITSKALDITRNMFKRS